MIKHTLSNRVMIKHTLSNRVPFFANRTVACSSNALRVRLYYTRVHAGEGMGGVKGLCSREPHSRGKSALGWLATARAAPLPKLVKFRGTQRTGEAGHCFRSFSKSFLTFFTSEIGFSFFLCATFSFDGTFSFVFVFGFAECFAF